MVKRLSDDIYVGLSPVEQACMHHLSMRADFTLPDGTSLPFADTGVKHIQMSTALNLFSADPQVGYDLLREAYGDDAAKVFDVVQELLVCTVDQAITPKELINQQMMQKAAAVVNTMRLFRNLYSKDKIQVLGAVRYPKLTSDMGFNILAISDKYRLLDEDRIERIMAPYQ